MIELRQRQRRAQLEAARFLLLRDGDGGEEGGFGGGGVGGVLFEEDFAANAVEFGVEPMLSGLARERQRFVYHRQGGLRPFPLGFSFCEPPFIERQKKLGAWPGVIPQRLPKCGQAAVTIADLRARTCQLQRAPNQIGRKTVLPAERHRGFRGALGRFSVVTEVFELKPGGDKPRRSSGHARTRPRARLPRP